MIVLQDTQSSKEAIDEAYFGKSKPLLEMENILDELRQAHMGEYNRLANTTINSNPTLVKFNRAVEDFFGFGCFSLYINNVRQANAHTVPVDFKYDYNQVGQNLVHTKQFKFDKKKQYTAVVTIYSGIIFNPNFTTPEVLAIILHEIGHSFNSAMNKSSAALTMLSTYSKFLTAIVNLFTGTIDISVLTNTNQWDTFMQKTEKFLRKYKILGLTQFEDFVQEISSICINGVQAGLSVLEVLTLGASQVAIQIATTGLSVFSFIRHPSTWFNTIVDKFSKKSSEKSADNFVTMYGYGPELTSALSKLEGLASDDPNTIIKVVDKIPVFGTLMHAVELPGQMVVSLFDEHPAGVQRAYDQLALLRREAQKEDLDPKLKKQILSDITECEKSMDQLMSTKDGIKDPYVARKAYNKWLNQIGKTDIFGKGSKDREKRFSAYDATIDSLNKR